MKKETLELIEELKDWYRTYRSVSSVPDWATSTVDDKDYSSWADEGASRMDKIISLLDKLKDVESTLATGGLVRDNAGNWLKHGDKISYRKDGETHKGTLYFDTDNLCWFCLTEQDDWLYLGNNYYEIEWFVARFELED